MLARVETKSRSGSRIWRATPPRRRSPALSSAGALTAAITWPPDQTLICRDTFVLTGTVSDPAAAIFATVTAPDGSVATLRGWVDRDQRFYIPDVPLSGTQATISVVASTETAVSSPALVSVVRAAYSLHDVTVGDLRRLEVFTSACIQKGESSLPNIATATVNGRSVTLANGVSGQTWAECVPMGLDSAFFLLRVVLTPASGLPVEWLGLYDKPITARLDQFQEGWSRDYWWLTTEAHAGYGSGDWRDNAPSTAHAWYSVPDYTAGTEFSFPADRFLHDELWVVDSAPGWLRSGPLASAGTIASLVNTPCSKRFHYQNTSSGNPSLRPLYIPNLWGALREIDLAWRSETPFLVETYSHHAGAQLVVQTGGTPGEPVPARLDLALFKAPAGMEWWAELGTTSLSGENVAQRQAVNPGGVQLGAYGTTDAQGRLYTMLPPNATVCVTPLFEGEVRDRVRDVDPASGSSFVWADFRTAPSLAFNVTMDTDQSGAPVPGGLDDRLRTTGVGCLVPVNDNDADHDGIPGFADGFNRDGVTDPNPAPPANAPSTDDTSTGDTFSTVVVTVAKGADPVTATLTFRYDAAPPSAVTATGTPPLWSPASTGHLRLWNRPGDEVGQRNASSILDGGDYLPPDVPIPLAQLGFTAAALQADAQLVSLSVEGINPSEHLGDQWLQIDFDPDGPGPTSALTQRARVTVTRAPDLDIDSDNTSGLEPPDRNYVEDWIEDDPTQPGKILAVNNGDKDGDTIPDFADGFNCDATSSSGNQAGAGKSARFVPLVVEIPWTADLSVARIRFRYAASNPANVTWTYLPGTYQRRYSAATGHLRLWTKDGDEPRNAAEVAQGGNYVNGRVDSDEPPSYSPAMIGLSSGQRTVTLYVEGVVPTTAGAQDGRIAFELDPDGPSGSAPFAELDATRVSVTPLQLAVDANRDGMIVFLPETADLTSVQRPYRFWLNDDVDRDSPDGTGPIDSAEDQQPGSVDGSDGYINGLRDLEDFTRVHVKFDCTWLAALQSGTNTLTFEWRNVQPGTAPGLRLFRAVEQDGGTNYLFNETVGAQQKNEAGLGIERVTPEAALTLPVAQYWQQLGTLNPPDVLHFLFEATGAGAGELVAVVSNTVNHTVLAESPPVHVRLASVTNLFEHYTVANFGNGDGWYHNDKNAWSQIPTNASHVAGARTYAPGDPEDPDYVLFVHGWRMLPWDRVAFAATAYKRLWWQGYKGRFGLYSWPTDYVELPGGLLDAPENYYRSERRAWHSAVGLRNLLRSLDQQYPGRAGLCAHSMGNIVASEALRQHGVESGQPVVRAYLAMQAASVAHAYDAVNPETTETNSSTDTAEVYASYPPIGLPYFTGMKFAVGRTLLGRYRTFNYHNHEDYALGTLSWMANQDLKPAAGYHYNKLTGAWSDWFNQRTLNITNDVYKIYAYVAEARSRALGAAAGYEGYTVTNQIGAAVDLNARFSFGANRYEHSAQFRSTIQRRSSFWQAAMNDLIP
jgi:hypothetical protein